MGDLTRFPQPFSRCFLLRSAIRTLRGVAPLYPWAQSRFTVNRVRPEFRGGERRLHAAREGLLEAGSLRALDDDTVDEVEGRDLLEWLRA